MLESKEAPVRGLSSPLWLSGQSAERKQQNGGTAVAPGTVARAPLSLSSASSDSSSVNSSVSTSFVISSSDILAPQKGGQGYARTEYARVHRSVKWSGSDAVWNRDAEKQRGPGQGLSSALLVRHMHTIQTALFSSLSRASSDSSSVNSSISTSASVAISNSDIAASKGWARSRPVGIMPLRPSLRQSLSSPWRVRTCGGGGRSPSGCVTARRRRPRATAPA